MVDDTVKAEKVGEADAIIVNKNAGQYIYEICK